MMFIKVTNWEAQRIADILRVGEVPPSQELWAKDLADKIEHNLERHKSKQKVLACQKQSKK